MDYASNSEIDSTDEMNRLFAENTNWLHHYNSMTNSDMLALAKTCHVGCLPTRDDTFGYSVLEFQACGLPCITTDSRALPEINNDKIGWMVKVPKLPNGRADFTTTEKLRELSLSIESGLVAVLNQILCHQEQIYEKGLCSLRNILFNHNPLEFGKLLSKIYKEALG